MSNEQPNDFKADIFDLSSRRFLITGASGGLGLHFATMVARRGAMVTLAARRIESLDRLRDTIVADGGKAEVYQLDVANEAAIIRLFASVPAFDVVINNAGISKPAKAIETATSDWDEVININLRAPFVVSREAAKAMLRDKRQGAIVNVASILGMRVAQNVVSYSAAKAGLIQLTKTLALEWARYGIRVNALCPGFIKTDLNREFFETPLGEALINRIPQRRLGHASDLDGALLLLSSDAGSYITGATIAADGGHLVSAL